MKRKKNILTVILELITVLTGIIYVYPVLLVFLNALKPLGDILVNPFSFPSELYLENLNYVLGTMK